MNENRPVKGQILTDKQREYLKLSKWDGVQPPVTRHMPAELIPTPTPPDRAEEEGK